jgi:hypothetical protein
VKSAPRATGYEYLELLLLQHYSDANTFLRTAPLIHILSFYSVT